MSSALAISHFLNCFLTTTPTIQAPQLTNEELFKTSKRRYNKRSSAKAASVTDQQEWTTLTQKSIWQQIRREWMSKIIR